MTDQTPTGEQLSGEQTDGTPSQPVTPASVEPTSQDSGVTLEQLSRRLETLERGEQSEKDRAVNRIQGEVTELREIVDRFNTLTEGGASQEDALFRMQVEDYMKQNPQVSAGIEQPRETATPQEAPRVIDPQVTIQAAGLNPEDPEVTAILGQKGDPTQALLELANKRKRPAAPETLTNTGGGSSAPEATLQAQYEAEVAQHRGNIRKVSEIQAKYARKGLAV